MRKEYFQCDCKQTQCPQFATCCKACCEVVYFNETDPTVHIMVVGQGAGKSEDIALTPDNVNHQPFFGISGRYLRAMIKDIVDAGTIFNVAFDNTVKFHPVDSNGKDREPTPEEIATCYPNLQEDIIKYQPEVLVAAGMSTTKALLPNINYSSMGKMNGKRWESDLCGRVTSPMYHPAFLTRTYGRYKSDQEGSIFQETKQAILDAITCASQMNSLF